MFFEKVFYWVQVFSEFRVSEVQNSGTVSLAVWIHWCLRTVAQYHQRYEYTVSDVSGQWHSITSSMNRLCHMFHDSGTVPPAVWIDCAICSRTVAQYHQQYECTVSDVSGQWHSITNSMNTVSYVSGQWHSITSSMNTLCHMFQYSGTVSPAVWIDCVICFRTVAQYHQQYE
jgi:hypothetical protein